MTYKMYQSFMTITEHFKLTTGIKITDEEMVAILFNPEVISFLAFFVRRSRHEIKKPLKCKKVKVILGGVKNGKTK